MRFRRGISGWLCALAALGAAPFGPANAQPLALERCRLEAQGIPAAFARCGTLAVPENPASPSGATVEIFVARIGALSAAPKPDPLLLIAGGPGQSTVDFYLQAHYITAFGCTNKPGTHIRFTLIQCSNVLRIGIVIENFF